MKSADVEEVGLIKDFAEERDVSSFFCFFVGDKSAEEDEEATNSAENTLHEEEDASVVDCCFLSFC